MAECFCGELIVDQAGVWRHVETQSRWCYPDEADTNDQAAPVDH
jgi:hypothetical protein